LSVQSALAGTLPLATRSASVGGRLVQMRLGSNVLILLALGLSASSHAASISNEASVNNAQSTPGNPRSGSVSDSLDATFDLGEDWSLLAGALLTIEESTPAPPGTAFGDRGGLVGTLSGGVEYHPGDSWTFGAAGDFSPKSTQRSGTQLNITSTTGAVSPANALLRATSSSSGIQLSAGYDSAGESSVEWSLSGGIGLTRLDTDQRIVALQEASGNVATTDAILRYCQTHTCSTALLQVIGPQPAARLESAKLSLGGTLTFQRDTDVTVSGDYYGYRQDPTQIGFFSIGSTGRMQINGGSGVPIAPLRYLVRPEVAHRMGDLSFRLWVQAGRYVEGAGQTTRGVGARLQYKLTKAFKMWVAASGQRDVDSEGNMTLSSTLSLGIGYKF
jgi:hypothetical protein